MCVGGAERCCCFMCMVCVAVGCGVLVVGLFLVRVPCVVVVLFLVRQMCDCVRVCVFGSAALLLLLCDASFVDVVVCCVVLV